MNSEIKPGRIEMERSPMLYRAPHKKTSQPFKQRGVVLMIALIVLVAMTLAGIALVRSVDTTNVIAGNLSFKRGVLNASELPINTVRAKFQTTPVVGPLSSDTAKETNVVSQNYSAVQLPVTNGRGIPDVLLNKATFDSAFTAPKITNASTKEEMRYIIERLCIKPGPSDVQYCVVADAGIPPGSDNRANLDVPASVLYRVTVRVDGPRNTISYIQNTFLP